ncbi:MAG: hypothetical protein WBA93_00780 [Microcoleaceae cyanobacterium]
MTESNVYLDNRNITMSTIRNGSRIKVDIYWHTLGLTYPKALTICEELDRLLIPFGLFQHINPACPDSIFIGSLVTVEEARLLIPLIPYRIEYIFPSNYSETHGGDRYGLTIGIGYMSNHYQCYRSLMDEPRKIKQEDLYSLIQSNCSMTKFQRGLRDISWLDNIV